MTDIFQDAEKHLKELEAEIEKKKAEFWKKLYKVKKGGKNFYIQR